MNHHKPLGATPAILSLSFASCSHLSDQAKEMVGNYYNTELSETEPVMELNSNGRCLIRAIKPGVLTYAVEGKWNVERDSLIIDTDGKISQLTGDSTLVGTIDRHKAMAVVNFNGITLTLRNGSADYIYTRRDAD